MKNKFLTENEKKIIIQAISEAERKTSGEIRVHILNKKNIKDILKEAQKIFFKLKMQKTKNRNGILLVIAPDDKKFAIIGDKGINDKIEPDYWENIKNSLQQYFKQQKFVEGICNAVKDAGNILSNFFPVENNDINELPDEVTES